MRPVRMAVRGFTAFRDEQELDFTDLDLFAIVGPTGSGKSSVLDAMTYALFGEVDRVDERSVRQMISQGQPRMAVTLEFEVGHDRYQVTRSLPRAGNTKIQVERWNGGEWIQAGEGSDRVTGANRILRGLIGLDFDGFTRSALLPQGKFSEFMSGDAPQRRVILTDLLGLSMFDRMGKRARQVAKEAKEKAETLEEVAAQQYGHATEEGLAEARRATSEAEAREAALGKGAGKVRALAERWRGIAVEVRELGACVMEGDRLARAAQATADTFLSIVEKATVAEATLAKLEAAASVARDAADAAARARAKAEEKHGTAASLAEAGARAERFAHVSDDLAARRLVLEKATARVPEAEEAQRIAESAAAGAVGEHERATEALAAAERSRDEVRHADQVADLVAALKPGDTCPVCGEPLASIPRRPGAVVVKAADREVARARKAEDAASKTLRDSEVAVAQAKDAAAAAAKEASGAAAEVARGEKEIAVLETALGAVLGELPPDPAGVIADRAAALNALARTERESADRAAGAERSFQEAKGAGERLRAEAAAARAGLEALAVTPLAERVSPLAPDVPAPDPGPDLPALDDLAGLAERASRLATSLLGFARALQTEAERRAASEAALLAEAEEAVAGLIPSPGSLTGLADAAAAAERNALEVRTKQRAEVERLEHDLAAVADLRKRIRGLRDRAARFRDLAQDLQADRLMAFLQAEALHLLAIGASRRLASLSSGRYELTYEGDEFLVVDRWNGDETRSVRTLSGGETFLASLALALALADQVTSLAVTDHASLDSLFLDEGFGTLDPETLEVVVEAIEQLGGDGRMVGVITHVRDLADRLPARLEIAKSPRGSTVLRAG